MASASAWLLASALAWLSVSASARPSASALAWLLASTFVGGLGVGVAVCGGDVAAGKGVAVDSTVGTGVGLGRTQMGVSKVGSAVGAGFDVSGGVGVTVEPDRNAAVGDGVAVEEPASVDGCAVSAALSEDESSWHAGNIRSNAKSASIRKEILFTGLATYARILLSAKTCYNTCTASLKKSRILLCVGFLEWMLVAGTGLEPVTFGL